MSLTIRRIDYQDAADCAAVVFLLNQYAMHPMGQSKPLDDAILERLPEALRSQPTAFAFLAEVEDEPAGIATCFWGFSTFKASRLINIHDLFVAEPHRGSGVGGKLIDAVKTFAVEQGSCAVTLEVVHENPARAIYASKGFAGVQGDPKDLVYFGKCAVPFGQCSVAESES
ncbi:MAG: GNAT family N-acetyltransferase [Aureliella sp.]